MVQRETCYFCTSTYQLFSIISLAATRKENADLYVEGGFKNAGEIAKRIEELHIFNKVRTIDSEAVYTRFFTHRRGFLNHLEIARSYVLVDRIAEMILGEDVCYRNMFVSSKAYIPRMVYFHFLKHKCDMTLYHFDDGVGSYYGSSAYTPKKLDVVVRKILFGREAVDLNKERFLFSPDLYKEINPDTTLTIHEIKKIWNRPEWLQKFNHIFGVSPDKGIKQKVIILDEPVKEVFTDENIEKIRDIYKMFIDHFGAANTIIKMHPRSKYKMSPDCSYYEEFGIPFEMICMNSDLTDSVLISYGSTASATPKMLMGKEPYVIMLYKLVPSKVIKAEVLEGFFQNLRKTYSDESRFLIPSTIDELKSMLASQKFERADQ